MKRVLVDTNVLVSFLTDRDAEQQRQARALFDRASQGGLQLVLHQTVLTELVFVLRNLYGVDAATVSAILKDLLAMAGAVSHDRVGWGKVLELWPGRFPDLGDAVLAEALRSHRCESVATFDRGFARRLRREGLEAYWSAGGAQELMR